jgi:hypothetical protein
MTSNITVIPPGGALARPKKAKPAAASLQLINAELSPAVVQALVDADRFRLEVQRENRSGLVSIRNYLGQRYAPQQGLLDPAKAFLRAWLPDIERAREASRVLFDIACMPMRSVSPADATAMLQFLFGAMGKRRNEEAAAKLAACADIFSPASNALGSALRLWKPVPRHPVVLAIAVKQLMASKTFEPAEAELREALGKVHQRLQNLQSWTDRWLEKLDYADNTVFTFDRPAWEAAYADLDNKIAVAMRDCVGDEDDDTARWQALEDLIQGKRALEQPRRAACATKPAKRTRGP